jgi:hypothetical protein
MVKFFSNYLPQVCNFWYTSFLNKWKQSTYTVWPKLSTTWLVSIISFLTMNLFQISLLFSLPVHTYLLTCETGYWSIFIYVYMIECVKCHVYFSTFVFRRRARLDMSRSSLGVVLRGLPAHGWSVTFTVWRKRCISRTMMEWLTLKWSATFLWHTYLLTCETGYWSIFIYVYMIECVKCHVYFSTFVFANESWLFCGEF